GLQQAGYWCLTASSGPEALAQLRRERVAVMLCDIRMPGMDGIEVLHQALTINTNQLVIMVTALAGLQSAMSAMRAGAYDYITKPFTFEEVEVAIKRALAYRRLQLANQ